MLDHSQRMRPEQAQFLRRIALFLGCLLSGGNNIFPRIPMAALLIGVCFLLQGMRLGFRREMAGNVMLMIATFTVAIIGSGQFFTDAIIIRFTNFGLGMLMLCLYLDLPRRQFVDDFYPILKFMCWQAIGTVILGFISRGLFVTIDVNESMYSTILLIFTFTQNELGSVGGGYLVRACGFFFEPGVFQIYLNMLVFMAGFVRRDVRSLGLALVAVLCTQSTMGLVLAGGMAALYYVQNMKTLPFPTKLLITALAPVILVPLAFAIIVNVNNKVSGDARGSAWARTYDLNTGLAVAAEHPWLGIGFDYSRYYHESLLVGYKETELDDNTIINRGNSNGIVTVIYSLGLPLALMYFLALFRQTLLPSRWIVPSYIFLSMMTEALYFSPLILMIIFSGLLLRPQQVPLQDWRGLRLAGN